MALMGRATKSGAAPVENAHIQFRVGMRVRVKDNRDYPCCGATATIVQLPNNYEYQHWLGVRFDAFRNLPATPEGIVAKWHRNYFEPIVAEPYCAEPAAHS